MIPEPSAWTILALNKTEKFGLNPAIKVPIKKINIAVKNTFQVEYL